VASLKRHIGANVKAVREQEGLSRREAAERLGIGRDYLASIERGEGNLTLRSVERLAEGLGVDVYVLVAENETVGASEATRVARALPPGERSEARAAARRPGYGGG